MAISMKAMRHNQTCLVSRLTPRGQGSRARNRDKVKGKTGGGDFDQGWEVGGGGLGDGDEGAETEVDEGMEAGPGAVGDKALEEDEREAGGEDQQQGGAGEDADDGGEWGDFAEVASGDGDDGGGSSEADDDAVAATLAATHKPRHSGRSRARCVKEHNAGAGPCH